METKQTMKNRSTNVTSIPFIKIYCQFYYKTEKGKSKCEYRKTFLTGEIVESENKMYGSVILEQTVMWQRSQKDSQT
jgi:hypothetical protein